MSSPIDSDWLVVEISYSKMYLLIKTGGGEGVNTVLGVLFFYTQIEWKAQPLFQF